MAFLQGALVRQKGRALHEKHGEGRQPEVGHGDIAAASSPGVRKGGANRLQARKKGRQKLHPYRESFFPRFGNPENALLLELLCLDAAAPM
jgi:hypothetical protein